MKRLFPGTALTRRKYCSAPRHGASDAISKRPHNAQTNHRPRRYSGGQRKRCHCTDDVSFGDNDRLAAQIANLWEADLLLILTNAPGLCRGENGEVVAQASANDDNLMNHVRSGDNRVGSGGMASKLSAAKIAARSGAHSFIVNGRAENCIARVLNDEKNLGTFLAAEKTQLSARKLWLASGLNGARVK